MEEVDTAVGPGSVVESDVSPQPTLDGVSEFEYVDILNPLPFEFRGKVAVTRPVNAPLTIVASKDAPGVTKTEQDIKTLYGLDLRNPDHQGRASIINIVPIKSGTTVRLPGNEAQVIVRQLVTEILAQRGRKLSLADPTARKEVEDEVIQGRGSIAEFMGTRPLSVSEQLHNALEESNNEFPEADQASERPIDEPGSRKPGRPAKTT